MKLLFNTRKESLLAPLFLLFEEITSGLSTLRSGLQKRISSRPWDFGFSREIEVWRTRDGNGEILWNAYDPISDRKIRGVSEELLRSWIERH
jgi:hypothetical protein